jgi:hypothetical protein
VLAPYSALGHWLVEEASLWSLGFGALTFIGPMSALGLVQREAGVYTVNFGLYGMETNIYTAWRYLVEDFSLFGPTLSSALARLFFLFLRSPAYSRPRDRRVRDLLRFPFAQRDAVRAQLRRLRDGAVAGVHRDRRQESGKRGCAGVKVFFFVVKYESDDHLLRFLRSSAAAMEGCPSAEALVHVQDNSRKPPEELEAFRSRLCTPGVPVTLQSTGTNEGYFGVLPLAQSLVPGDADFAIYCNPDLLLDADFLRNLERLRGGDRGGSRPRSSPWRGDSTLNRTSIGGRAAAGCGSGGGSTPTGPCTPPSMPWSASGSAWEGGAGA